MGLLRNCRNATLALLSSFVALSAAPAHADFHTFVIDELYTTADGAVQYIVLREAQGANGQNVFAGHSIVSANATTVKTFPFPTNLPSATTANKRVLIGSTSYAALGLVAPDYTMPDRFLPTEGGTLNYGGVDIIGFPALPTDGTNAWFRSGSIGANVATNFAGATGSVPTAPVTVIEFYNMALDHYFISPLAPDIDALDSGRLAGWVRTGFTFKANPAAAAGVNPVCRFYIPPQKGDSHFFTASPAECADVVRQDRHRPELRRLFVRDAERVLHRAARSCDGRLSGRDAAGLQALEQPCRLQSSLHDQCRRPRADARARATSRKATVPIR